MKRLVAGHWARKGHSIGGGGEHWGENGTVTTVNTRGGKRTVTGGGPVRGHWGRKGNSHLMMTLGRKGNSHLGRILGRKGNSHLGRILGRKGNSHLGRTLGEKREQSLH